MAPMLDESDPRAIKVRVTGEALGMHRRTVRNAIRLLLGMGFLDCAKPPNRGAPGLYRIGQAASQSQRESLRTTAKAGSPADYPLTSAR